jgi:hypothetical protein
MNDTTKGLIRHLLTAGGGVLVSKGVISEADLPTVVGSILTIAGVLWSVLSKRSNTTAI